jgi:DNA-binding MarR family transcriptional regulator
MNYVTGQFVCLPRIFELNSSIKYTDLVVYIAVRSFNNPRNDCYPAYETIAERAGCGRSYVINAIKRLELANLLKVTRSKKIKVVNRYKFPAKIDFEQIPYQLFDADLTLNEKAMLLWLRQHVKCVLSIPFKLKKLATLMKISYKIVYQQTTSLMKKGYVDKNYHKKNFKDYTLTDKLQWKSDYGAKKEVLSKPIIIC